ncbi:MAG: hypothetical protein GY851_36375, partial [bacterium]|nr:hypothetical protein [bacterium]
GDWKQGTAPLINSEYGGVSAGSGDRDISWVFLFLTNLLRKYDMIGGYVYTELSDIEWEHNGFMNYDRSPKDYHYPAGITVADLQQDEFPVLDCPPYQRVNAGDRVSIPILLSQWSEREGLRLRVSAVGTTVDGKDWSNWIEPVERDVQGKPFVVTPCGSFDFTAPDARGLVSVVAEVLVDGKRHAANYCVVDVRGGAAWQDDGQFAVSVPVQQFSEYAFDGGNVFDASRSSKVSGHGVGHVEYQVQLPKDLRPEDIAECRLIAEVGSQANRERVEWPERVKPGDYPQTDGIAWPTDVAVSLNGASVASLAIENDCADARGVLSHVAHFHHGSNGVVADMPITGDALKGLKKSLADDSPLVLRFAVPESAKNKGGLSLYGADMGARPADPTLVFTLKPGVAPPKEEAQCVDIFWTKQITLVKCGPEGHTWRYTFKRPGENWRSADYSVNDWREAKAGFGTRGTPGARPTTIWEAPNVWLRTSVTVPENFHDRVAWVRLHHDEDVQVYVNGRRLIERKGYRSDYDQVVLDEKQRKLFRPGKPNTIAIHCSQTAGGQFVDFGLSVLE